MLKLGNLRRTSEGIRCDRCSPVGNPFELSYTPSNRPEVCAQYDLYFDLIVRQGYEPKAALEKVRDLYPDAVIATRYKLPSRMEFMNYLHSIQDGDTILCWCVPLQCHCETIRRHITPERVQLSLDLAIAIEG